MTTTFKKIIIIIITKCGIGTQLIGTMVAEFELNIHSANPFHRSGYVDVDMPTQVPA